MNARWPADELSSPTVVPAPPSRRRSRSPEWSTPILRPIASRPVARSNDEPTIAVIDVGSNSGRVVVLRMWSQGHLQVIADSRAPLRLARETQRGGALSSTTIRRTVAALLDFQTIAASAGADRTIAVGTAAVREASNRRELVDRVRD